MPVFELESATDVAAHILYDPAATAHINVEPDAKGEFIPEDELKKGSALQCYTASDGCIFMRLYVDEPIPPDLAAQAGRKIENLLLKVPSGTLVASGMEYLNDKKELQAAKPYTYSGSSSLVTKADIPPGNYLVDAYEYDVDWDEEVAPLLKKHLGFAYTLESYLGPGMGCSIFLAVIGGIVAISRLIKTGWNLSNLAWFLIPLTFAITFVVLYEKLLPKDYQAKKTAIAAQFPPYVLVFKRLAPGADLTQYHGGDFGSENTQ